MVDAPTIEGPRMPRDAIIDGVLAAVGASFENVAPRDSGVIGRVAGCSAIDVDRDRSMHALENCADMKAVTMRFTGAA